MNARGTTAAEIADLIAKAEAMGAGHIAHLLRPVMAGNANLIIPMRDTRMPPLHRLGKMGRPITVLVGDDDYRPAGPTTWACAAKLRSWAAFALVHGAGADPEHYLLGALTSLHRRLLFIETTSAAAQDWAGFLRERADLPFMGVLPSDGPHPVTMGTVH